MTSNRAAVAGQGKRPIKDDTRDARGVMRAMFEVLDRTLFRAHSFLIDPGTAHRVYTRWTEVDGRRLTERWQEYPRQLDFARWTTSVSKFAGVAATTLIGVAVLASVLPAMRATRVDANVALRTD